MSHAKERHEKICLNCKTELVGRYCQTCGQENIEPHETVWGLVHHFFADITHFDGKFFSTVRYLITRPGFLSKEYISGRRASYLHPIRMYVFTSAVFFLIFFSVFHLEKDDVGNKLNEMMRVTDEDTFSDAEIEMLKKAKTHSDSVQVLEAYQAIRNLRENVKLTGKKKKDGSYKKAGESNFMLVDSLYGSREQYDSIQAALPPAARDGYFKRQAQYRNIYIHDKYGGDNNAFWTDVVNKFLHMFPYLLFISLPLYALFMKLLYMRRKQFLYVDHAIFFIHLYIFTFLFLLVQIAIYKLNDGPNLAVVDWLQALLVFAGIYYTYKAMRKFYGQGRLKTITKFMILNLLCFISLNILFGIFIFLSVFRV